ncbi:hypothetical protein NE237_005641 [Protea cynaroides]|uniref:Uncharacterized protein n=1 Tax=Protea cynaroides TaxID=273540 RepID=A0A9Q0KKZ3_9MAGN|nr:hypothetical protein NE237_005641 [Protea cynaroides]
MAAMVATMTMSNAKCLSINSPNSDNPSKPSFNKPISLISLQNLPKVLISSKSTNENSNLSSPLAGTAIAGAIFSTLSSCDPALAAQQIAEIAEGDNRGLALLLPIIPAIAWVLFNILQPALNQINRMRSSKGIIVGAGLSGGLAASSFLSTPSAAASEIAMIADASSDNRGLLLLFVVAPAIFWVFYNILQPALNQINRMSTREAYDYLREIQRHSNLTRTASRNEIRITTQSTSSSNFISPRVMKQPHLPNPTLAIPSKRVRRDQRQMCSNNASKITQRVFF